MISDVRHMVYTSFLEEWAWYRLLAHALIFRRYLADSDNNVYGIDDVL